MDKSDLSSANLDPQSDRPMICSTLAVKNNSNEFEIPGDPESRRTKVQAGNKANRLASKYGIHQGNNQ